ncbi:MAG: tRNA pseudouridine(55) synthase TruB [Saprospiraceae bacterium]|jgi:tRNA pseudouridine55 synthase|nr:tRNA pseudouridine(55) synthase TruB [Saprospiraceae bacterium]
MIESQNPTLESFLEAQVVLIDKPLDWTSFDVVNRLRITLCRKLKVRKLKVGHAGTLDPKATGLLIICTGRATKRITEFQDQAKTYTGEFALGSTRPSFDVETEIDGYFPTEHINSELLGVATNSFLGNQLQMPPVYSAIKQDGKPVYQKAHKGEADTVVMQPREVEIYDFKTYADGFPLVNFEVKCSKGTYIRSLASDFGKRLDSGAYLNKLRRTAIGDYSVNDAWDLKELITYIENYPATIPS